MDFKIKHVELNWDPQKYGDPFYLLADTKGLMENSRDYTKEEFLEGSQMLEGSELEDFLHIVFCMFEHPSNLLDTFGKSAHSLDEDSIITVSTTIGDFKIRISYVQDPYRLGENLEFLRGTIIINKTKHLLVQ